MKRLILLIPAIVSGCGTFGYKSEYTAKLPAKQSVEIGKLYYETKKRSIDNATTVAGHLADVCLKASEQIGKPIAPVEAVHPRTEVMVTGSGKEFDIVKSVPPEPLLPLLQERTKQFWAITHSIIRTAEMAHIPIAAPPDYVQDTDVGSTIYDAFLPILDTLPTSEDAAVDEKVPDDFEDVRQQALKQMEDEKK